MQTYLESGEMHNALAKTSTVLANTLPNSKYENWAAWRVYLPHVTALLANLMEDSEASVDLCMKSGNYLHETLGWYSESLILYEWARKLYVGLFGEENTKTLPAIDNIGVLFRSGERLKEAQDILEKVLEVSQRTHGEEHPDILKSMQHLAIAYRQLGGKLKEVQELEEKVCSVRHGR
jgi:tetratricopeptide (TPR) repeat protein